MAPAKIPTKVRAQAIADLMVGEQPADVAAKYGIDAGKVRVWKQRYVTPAVTKPIPPTATVPHRPTIEMQQLAIGDLIMECLRAKIIATQRIADHATTSSWIEKQSAAELAELFIALDQSAVGVLDRLARRGHAGGRYEDAD